MSVERSVSSDDTRNSAARAEMLRRVRTALHDVPADEQPEQVPVERAYRKQDTASHEEIIELFMERVADYKATIRRISAQELVQAIATSCAQYEVHTLVVPADIPQEWLPEGLTILRDSPQQPLTHEQLDHSDGVLFGCSVAIAQTGTIVLDGGALQGRRVLSLLPDYALCVVRSEQIVGIVPEAIARLSDAVHQQRAPITMISGPSATSDIELNRVEGVHGPRKLEVLVLV